MEIVVGPWQECELKKVFVNTRELVRWNCVSLLVSYCCDIAQNKVRSRLSHSVSVKWPCLGVL